MIKLNIHEAKTHLSRYIPRLLKGEVIFLCKRNIPIAKIVGLSPESDTPRPVGRDKGVYVVPDSFFEPLPDDVLKDFEHPE